MFSSELLVSNTENAAAENKDAYQKHHNGMMFGEPVI
jgi:hypothetical protein